MSHSKTKSYGPTRSKARKQLERSSIEGSGGVVFAIASWLNPLGGLLSAFLAVVACALLFDIVLRSPWTYRLPTIVKGPVAVMIAAALGLLLGPSVQAKFVADHKNKEATASENEAMATREENSLAAARKVELERPDTLFESRQTVRPFVPILPEISSQTAADVQPPLLVQPQKAAPMLAIELPPPNPSPQPVQQTSNSVAPPTTSATWINVNMQQMARLVPLLAQLRPVSGNGTAVTLPPQDVPANEIAQLFFSAFIRAGLQPQLINEMPRGPEEHGVMIGTSDPAKPTKKEVQLQAAVFQATGLKPPFIEKPNNYKNFDYLVFVGPQ